MAKLEYFYTALSLYAYLGSARIQEIAKAADTPLIHKPVHLRKVLPATGRTPIADRGEANYNYYFRRESARWAEYRGVELMEGFPTHHKNDETLCNTMIIAAIQQGVDAGALSHAILRAHWVDDMDHADADQLAAAARVVGIDPKPLLAAAGSDEVAAIYQANTDEAIERSMFGAPTYFVDGDMFYGQDRLEMVERALTKPFAGKWPL